MAKAPEIQRINRQTLRKWRKRAAGDLYFFQKAIWQDKDLSPEFHIPLCRWLEEYHPRRMLAMFRASFKSSCVRAYLAIMGLENVNWSSLLIEQREQNAIAHMEMIQQKFRQSALLQDMYSDRLQNFEGWNQHRTIFARTDANALPFMSVAGLDSKLESNHYDFICADDLEGADAEKSDAPNEDSHNFVLNRALPLLKQPDESGILVVGTAHGNDPLIWKLRDIAELEERSDPDNPLRWRYYWKEATDSEGNPRFPERVSRAFLKQLEAQAKLSRKSKLLLDKQYYLRRHSTAAGFFDMERIEQTRCKIEGRVIVYPVDESVQKDVLDNAGFPAETETRMRSIDIAHCRPYMHLDMLHKEPEERIGKQESKWAILATLVSPDFHTFVVDAWLEDAGMDEALRRFFAMYRRWVPHCVTIDPIGAQTWIKTILRGAERTTHKSMASLPTLWRERPVRCPRPSSRIEEAERRSSIDKEAWILEQLEVQFNLGWLHIADIPKMDELMEHLRNVGTGAGFMDGADALAQGPAFWQPPISPKALLAMKRRKMVLDMMGAIEPITGYIRRFKDRAA